MAQDLFVEADAAVRQSPEYGAGAGDHLPVGTWSGVRYRALMRFPILTGGWGIATRIVSAQLTVYVSDHQHVGPRNSQIYARKQTVASLWTGAAGTQSCESGFSAGNATQWPDTTGVSATDQVQFSSGTTANAAKTLDVTDIVEWYRQQGSSKIVFIFDQVTASDYTELWADEKSGYAAHLLIEYETISPPNAPTPTAPAVGAVSTPVRPVFSWTHNDPQGDAQNNAEVRVYDAAGTTLLYTWNPSVGSTQSLTAPLDLVRGTTYQWEVRTSDAVSGYGPYSAKRSFSIKALPVVTITATRFMEFANGAPRLRVKWTADQTQTHYRVQKTAGPAFDSGWIPGTAQEYLLSSVALADNTAVSITVSVRSDPLPLEGSASRSFTPRWGLTTQRRDLTTAPVNWGTPTVVATVPTGASLVIEYGSDVAAIAAPSAWFSALSAVPKKRYLFYRAWLIPSATQGPTFDRIDIPSDGTVAVVDKWGTTRDSAGLSGPWVIDTGEYVYGSRSVSADVSGAGPFLLYAYGIKVRAGRSYILTGLMKSQGNSGAMFRLEDAAGTVLTGGGITVPVGPVASDQLTADTEWFRPGGYDVYRYKTPVWVADSDRTVYVALRVGGTAGSKAWFDAIKLEESTVATPWSPGAVGATIVDAGGVQVDGYRGGVFRYRGSGGTARDVVEGGTNGLNFGGDTPLYSPAAKTLRLGSPGASNDFALQIGDDAVLLDVGVTDRMGVQSQATPANGGFVFGSDKDTDLFRAAANTLKTNDAFQAAGLISALAGLTVTGLVTNLNALQRFGGTSFPGSPASGDQFWRTDLRLLFFYDGTRWLTADLFTAASHPAGALAANSSSMYLAFAKQAWTGFNIWVERIVTVTFINAGTALSGSHKWVGTATGFISGGAVWGTIADISSGASSTWREWVDTEGSLLGSDAVVRLTWTKTGTPGDLTAVTSATYRMVAT